MHEGEFTIGRSRDNSLQLEDSAVSGKHAVIIGSPNEYLPEILDLVIKDLNSTNGTWVNHKSLQEKKLFHGDVIKIGSHQFKVFDEKVNDNTQTEYYVPED
jgi:pSer/pThr/pTyr-binding forkhead associated (FHA) protein